MRLLAGPGSYGAVAELLVQAIGHYPPDELAEAAIALRAAAPTHRHLWALTDDLVYALVPQWHWRMLQDRARNRAYRDAIRANVAPGMQVLEIGAGTGILAMMAAAAGAEHVWTVEVNPLMAKIAQQCIARNGFADRVSVLTMHSSEVVPGRDLPRRADLLIHEILCRSALTEGLAPTLHHAQDALLVPGAPLLPDFVGIEAVLSTDIHGSAPPWWQVDGFDLSPLGLLDAAAHAVPDQAPPERLSAPVGVAEIDLSSPDLMVSRRFTGPLEANRRGIATGVEQWMKIRFPGGTMLSSDDPASSWGPCYHPFGTAREVTPGAQVDIVVSLGVDVLSIGLAGDGDGLSA
ncbi:MAG: 50S ribosomal protein L11 methyltransferase [Pseudomonadota bacterium]